MDANQAHLDPDNDGWDNATEHIYRTKPNLADSDEDGLDDPDDADPHDPTIDWPRAPEATRVWIPLEGYDSSTHGAPVALSNTGIALFEKAIWKAGIWKMLEWVKEGPTVTITSETDVHETTLHAIRALDIADDGRILGVAILGSTTMEPGLTDIGDPGHSVQWSENQNGDMVITLTGCGYGAALDYTTFLGLKDPAAVSPDGFLLTRGFDTVADERWQRHGPTQWNGQPGQTIPTLNYEELLEDTVGGVWAQARSSVRGGALGLRRSDGTNRLLTGDGIAPLPPGYGYVCGALADNRVGYVSLETNGSTL